VTSATGGHWTGGLGSYSPNANNLSAPRPFVKTKFTEFNALFSPDGKWIAYQSNESGRFEIYARSFPDGDRVVQLTADGGLTPAWSANGRELFYRGTDNKIKVVAVDLTSSRKEAKPRVLFDGSGYENTFSVAADGKRLLMMPLIPRSKVSEILDAAASNIQTFSNTKGKHHG